MDKRHDDFSLFVWFYALAVFTHHIASSGDPLGLSGRLTAGATQNVLFVAAFQLLPVGAAVAALIRPDRPLIGFLMFASNLLLIALEGITIVNHWLAEGLMGLLVVTAFVTRWWRERRFPRDYAGLAEYCYPVIRLLPGILFIWAAVHKLNSEFFDADRSCATIHYLNLGWVFGSMPDTYFLREWLSYIVVAVEFVYAILLLVPRTRLLGIALALPFHLVMGLNGWVFFGTMYFSFYVTMLPDGIRARLLESLSERALQIIKIVRFAVIGVCLLVAGSIFVLTALTLFAPSGAPEPETAAAGYRRLWAGMMFNPPAAVGHVRVNAFIFTAAAGIIAMQIFHLLVTLGYIQWYVRNRLQVVRVFLPTRIGICGSVVLGLFVLNGFGPYLGFKTAATFSMFSNLQTENSVSNHYVFTKDMQVFDYQDHLVQIVEFDGEHSLNNRSVAFLRSLAGRNVYVVEFELARHVYHACADRDTDRPMSLTYRRGQDPPVREPDVCANPALTADYNPFLGRLLFFKPVKLGRKRGCPWG